MSTKRFVTLRVKLKNGKKKACQLRYILMTKSKKSQNGILNKAN